MYVNTTLRSSASVDETKCELEHSRCSARRGLPVAVHAESATPHEVTLVYAPLAQRFVKAFPMRLIGDNAYESDRLDADLGR